jgi:hypothetical protein
MHGMVRLITEKTFVLTIEVAFSLKSQQIATRVHGITFQKTMILAVSLPHHGGLGLIQGQPLWDL